jgi:beta-mannosidase
VLVADLDGRRALWYGLEAKDTAFAGSAPDIAVDATTDGLRITFSATRILRDLLVQADRIHPRAVADRGFLTLLPGESTTVTVHCDEPVPPEAIHQPWAIAWLDDVIRR